MNYYNKILLVFCTLVSSAIYAQQSHSVVGIVLNEEDIPVENVQVTIGNQKTITDQKGFYQIFSPTSGTISIEYFHKEYQPLVIEEYISAEKINEINVRIGAISTELEVIVIDQSTSRYKGEVKIDPSVIRKIPSANAGVESIIKSLPGVNSNSELSTQYSVRGGSYDENLVYVNEIEVYRPFLVRSGQQEGLSFTNTSMVQSIHFSAGGFQSKYGDKMASVLDIMYRRPTQFGFEIDASILGGGITVDWASKNGKWSTMQGLRYRNNKLLVDSQDVNSEYSPRFLDFQNMWSFQPNAQWDITFLGNVSKNTYNFQPQTRVTNFGTLTEPKQMLIYYQGKELDKYQSVFGSVKTSFKPNKNNYYRLILSTYHTIEEENYDILASYNIGDVSTDLGGNAGGVEYTEALGTQLNHGRNKYDALMISAEAKATHTLNNKDENKSTKQIEWGIRYLSEDIRDRLSEWEVVDSAGFHIAPPLYSIPNNQPYTPYTGELVPFQNVKSINFVKINRAQTYAQYSTQTYWGENQIFWNIGVRSHFWQVISGEKTYNEIVYSPRAQFSIKPNWNADILFRISGGIYHQPPSYRELRRLDGKIQENLKAQQSAQIVLGGDYSFRWKKIPLKLTAEAYYKHLDNVNTYTIENIRIRYRADNQAQAYVYGLDMRLNGEIVPGTESWLSFGYMKTEENYQNNGYISRPTDQRLKFALLFQDYMPAVPNLKLYLNLVYNTGLPGGSPTYANPYDYQQRLPDYKRADAGFIYVLKDHNIGVDKKWLKNWQQLTFGFEIYNLFQNANSITNTWVRDVYSKVMYGLPNYMTMRTFNVKINAKW